jgi:hypothetical protein
MSKGKRLPGKDTKVISITKTENGFLVQSIGYKGEIKFYNASTKEEALGMSLKMFKGK